MLPAPRILLFWAGLSYVCAIEADVTPLTKVVQLLGDLKAQLEDIGQKETESYNEYNNWCNIEAQASKTTISDTKAKTEDIEAFLQEQEAFREQRTAEIHETQAEVSGNENDLQEAQAQRSQEHKVYLAAESEYEKNIQQLELAIQTMQKKQPGGGPKSPADLFAVATILKHALERNPELQFNGAEEETLDNFFRTAQMMSSGQSSQRQPMGFLQTGGNQVLMAPDYGDYQQQAECVTQTLQEILDREKVTHETALRIEQRAADTFALVERSLSREITEAKEGMMEKQSKVAKSEETCSQRQQELDAARQLDAETSKYLNDVTATCEQKAHEFRERTQLRSNEIAAVQQAIQILAGAQQLATKGSLGASFLQTRSVTHKVIRRLQGSGSAALSFLAVRMQNNMISLQRAGQTAGADPLNAVRKMIEEMIVRLLNEAAEEAEHKGWCDTETAKSEESKKEREKDITSLTTQIDEMQAQKAQLIDEMQQLQKDMLETDQMAAEAMAVRTKEKHQALISIKEYADAQTLIGNAITVLQEYYTKKNQASFAPDGEEPGQPSMEGRPAAPAILQDGIYKADDTASSSIIGMLENAQSDFAKLQSETETQEQTAQREYQNLMNDSQVKKKDLDKDMEDKKNTKAKLEKTLLQAKSDLDGAKKELEAVEAYILKLKPSCGPQVDSFEDRKARREHEIKSLQEALALMNGEATG